MKKKTLITAVLLFMLAASGFGEEPLISIDFQRVPLRTVLRILSDRTDRKLITDTDLAQMEIVLTLEDVSADEALNALLDTYELYYIRQPDTDIYVIKSRREEILIKVSQVFSLNYANPEDLIPIIEPQLNIGGGATADKRTNSLIVTDLADNINRIGELIARLDTPTPQVFIEAKILELNISDALEMGMDLTDFKYVSDSDAPVYNQEFARNIEGPSLSLGVIERGYNIDALIKALQTKTEARMLNNPKILVLSNRTASIDIVDELPYQELTETAEGGRMATTSFKDVGVQIEATPYVNRDGTIIMDIIPAHSFQTGVSPDGIPIVKSSRVNTSFQLNDGDTVVIGGLIRETDSSTHRKVPFIGDIPIIGYLFQRTDREQIRNELTVFITARKVIPNK